ncbi:hypothetical protein N185_32790 [Sinorhizobium sp. GW3]|nr:hypothetical protein N185_32790 [Sinorhizobium sp. GW3]
MNLLVCLPVQRLTPRSAPAVATNPTAIEDRRRANGSTLMFSLMLIGFAVEGYALSAILVHMVPLTQALGLGAAGLLVASLFASAQVASRLINLTFGKELSQRWLAVIATALLPIGLVILRMTTPWGLGAVLFAICFGLGSGLTSIVGGTLPLELFGREGYGRRFGGCGCISGDRRCHRRAAPAGGGREGPD